MTPNMRAAPKWAFAANKQRMDFQTFPHSISYASSEYAPGN